MKRKIITEKKCSNKEFFEGQGYRNIWKRSLIAFGILLVVIVVVLIYFFVFDVGICSNSQCFVDAMRECDKVSWIRSDVKASWLYTILGDDGRSGCNVGVKLLQVKQGTVENEQLVGKSMVCGLRKGETQFPEKDILSCSGPLREEMQEIIIQNMHNYLLENIGEVSAEFGSV